MRRPLVALCSAWLLAGCQPGSAFAPHPADAPEARGAVAVRPLVNGGPAYRTLDLVEAYTASDVARVSLHLFTVDASGEAHVVDPVSSEAVVVDLPATGLADPARFDGLRLNTPYRIRAYAYDSLAAPISIDASSSVDLTLKEAGTATMVVPVQLRDRPFDAEASSPAGIEILDGGFVSTPSL